MKISEGATIWARQTIESKIFSDKPDRWFKIWFYIVNKVNHKDTKSFKRGSCFTKYEWISESTKASKNEIDHCIRFLKSATMIATQKATRGMYITVLNYDKYQNLDNYKSDTKSDTLGDLKAKQKRNRSDTINKNGKNERSSKETQTPPFLKEQNKHFEHQVGEYFKNIKTNCEIILNLKAKNGRPFNPFEFIQEKVNKARHPGAINESLSGLIQNWEGIENPYGYANSILKTTNPNWIEKDNIIKSKEKWLIIKEKMTEMFKEIKILKRV